MNAHSFTPDRRHNRGAYFVYAPVLFISALLVALLATTYLSFTPGLAGPFLLDDAVNISPLELETLSIEELRRKVLSGPFGGLSRCVTMTSLALTQYASGSHPYAFKYQNLMLHLVNGLLVFWIAALLFRSSPPILAAGWNRSEYWPALIVAAIWLLHPLQVSTVLYAVQRLVLLASLFCLSAMVCYLEGRGLISHRPAVGISLILIGLLIFWPLGLLSKENALLLAPALLLVESLLLSREPMKSTAGLIVRLVVISFFIFPIFLGVAYVATHVGSITAGYSGRDFNLTERLLTEIHVLWFYLQLILFPVPTQMGLFHDAFPVQRTFDVRTAIGILGLVALCLGSVTLRRRAPLIAFGVLWFFTWHLMESTLVSLELVFEHRNYLALFGIALALTATGMVVWRALPRVRLVLVPATVAMIALLSLNTAARALTWGSYESFFSSEYLRSPRSGRAIESMYLLAKLAGDRSAQLRFIKELREVERDAWPIILEIQYYCGEQDVPPALLREALRIAAIGPVTPAVVSAVGELDAIIGEGQCAALPAGYLYQLVSTLAANPRSHIPAARISLQGHLAALSIRAGDFGAAIRAIRTALAEAAITSPTALDQTAAMIGAVASQIPDPDQALQFVEQTTEGFEEQINSVGSAITLKLGGVRDSLPLESSGE